MTVDRLNRIIAASITKQLWSLLFYQLLIGVEGVYDNWFGGVIHCYYFTLSSKPHKPLTFVVK